MSLEVKVPRLAESISEATLVEWLKPDGGAVRVDEPEHRPERRRLARAVGAEKPRDRARLDPEAEPVDRLRLPVALAEPVDLDHDKVVT